MTSKFSLDELNSIPTEYPIHYNQWNEIPVVPNVLLEPIPCRVISGTRVLAGQFSILPSGHWMWISQGKMNNWYMIRSVIDVRIFHTSDTLKESKDLMKKFIKSLNTPNSFYPVTMYVSSKNLNKRLDVCFDEMNVAISVAECVYNLSKNIYIKNPSPLLGILSYRLQFLEIKKMQRKSLCYRIRKLLSSFVNGHISEIVKHLRVSSSTGRYLLKYCKKDLRIYFKSLPQTTKNVLQKRENFPDLITESFYASVVLSFAKDLVLQAQWNELVSSQNKLMTLKEFHVFLDKQGHAEEEKEECVNYVNRFILQSGNTEKSISAPYITFVAWLSFLMGENGSLVSESSLKLNHNMNKPLSHYFISSSHNTYLEGHQLYGSSSIYSYRKALLCGYRCIELDVWEDSLNKEPKITHGNTIVSSISFRDVLLEIRNTAFKVSQFPLILSVENHCGTEYKDKMANALNKILGDMTIQSQLDNFPCQKGKPLPSPECLAGKILIKDKLCKEKVCEWNKYVVYIQAKHFESLEISIENDERYKMSSFVETKSINMIRTSPDLYRVYNLNHLSRIYPKGTRISSDNYDPRPHFGVGCQIVALNSQTEDDATSFNSVLFEQNGCCGYVLKPQYLLNPNPKSTLSSKPLTITINIFEGIFLSRTPASVRIEAVIEDFYSKESAIVESSSSRSFCHIFRKSAVFEVKNEECSFLTFYLIFRGSSKASSSRSFHLKDLKHGIRHVNFYCYEGSCIVPTLFVQVFRPADRDAAMPLFPCVTSKVTTFLDKKETKRSVSSINDRSFTSKTSSTSSEVSDSSDSENS